MKKVKLRVRECDIELIDEIRQKFNLSEISAKILINRNFTTIDEVEEFLHPDYKYFESADNFKDLQKGCNRILEAIKKGENILIYGDYDVDGVTSISQFMMLLNKANANVDYYVPDRENEGYGISEEFINKLKSNSVDADLIVTVDCGISEIEKVETINSLNKEVIIIDHHQCKEILPDAYAIINPKQKNCSSKNKLLCAAGLSFKFLKNLNLSLKIDHIEDVLLELACLGTLADIVDLVGDNRIIGSNGLQKIKQSKILGLRKLIELAGVKLEQIESYHVGYILAPRINAAGRMGTARTAIELMLTDDEDLAKNLALELEELNNLRKTAEKEIIDEAIKKIEQGFLYKKNVIVVSGNDWHEGVLGIVASKLTETYEKPSIVISVKDNMGKGSARSLDYIDIFEAFKTFDYLFNKFGGHKLAAGLTIPEKNINLLMNELNNYIGNINLNQSVYKDINVDAEINLSDVTLDLFKELSLFEPFGAGNQKPLFKVSHTSIKNLRKLGKEGKHLSFILKEGENEATIIGFNKMSVLEKILLKPSAFGVNIGVNEFNNKKNIQLILQNVEDSEKLSCEIDDEKTKILYSIINKTKSKIMKIDIFLLVEKINKLYNTKITAEEIVCILKNTNKVEYALKNDILYIKN